MSSPNAFRTAGSLHHEPPPRVDDTRCVTENQLQLGPADFNAEQ